jgi:hypothetical protein
MEPEFGFGEALNRLKAGKSVARKGWDTLEFLTIQEPYPNSVVSVSYILAYMRPTTCFPWIPSYVDMFAYDWCEIILDTHAPEPIRSATEPVRVATTE